jgi:hypothetical protein
MHLGCLPSNGNLPREETRVKKVRDRLGDDWSSNLKEERI